MKLPFLSVCALTLLLPVCVSAEEPVSLEQLPKQLVGTWRFVSATYDGRESDVPERLLMLKHVTPSHETWMRIDAESGEVITMASGKWKLEGNQFSSTPEYGMGDAFSTVKGQTHTFTCKIVGNRWYHTGKLATGLTIDEMWERVEGKDEGKERRAEPR